MKAESKNKINEEKQRDEEKGKKKQRMLKTGENKEMNKKDKNTERQKDKTK